MKKIITLIFISLILVSCKIETQAEEIPSEYWMQSERVSDFGLYFYRLENKEAVCYAYSGNSRGEGNISCFKK